MKKLITFVLVLCMVISLGACKKPAEQSGGSTGQTEKITEGTNTPTSGETEVPPESNNVCTSETPDNKGPAPEVQQPAWTTKAFNTYAGLQSMYSQDRSIQRVDYETWQKIANTMAKDHKVCAANGYCERDRSSPCETGYYFRSNFYTYDKAYFKENTMVVIGLKLDANTSATVTDVRYADGTVTCFVEIGRPMRRELNCYTTIYVHVEQSLPENTELKLEVTVNQQPESEIPLNWKGNIYSLSGWDLFDLNAPRIAHILDWESYQAFAAECNERGSACPTYSKAFFDTHRLIAIGWGAGSGSDIFELYNLHYANGTLTCTIDRPYFEGMSSLANIATWICYIEVDAVLPADTELVVDMGSVKYDQETYIQKKEQFY